MPKNRKRPVGVTILGFLHVVLGVLGTVIVLGLAVLAIVNGARIQGVPLWFLVALAAPIVLGITVGVAVLRGRGWSWYVVTSLYALHVASNAYFLAGPGTLPADTPTSIAENSTLAMAAQMGLAVMAYAYCQVAGVREYFGLGDRARWRPIVGQVLGCLAIVAAVHVAKVGVGSDGQAQLNVARIQALGERRTIDDMDLAFLIERIELGGMEERVSAAWALGMSRRSEALPQLFTAARKDVDTYVRVNAIGSLVQLGGEGVEEALLEFLAEDELPIRAAALRGISEGRYRAAVPNVAALLSDPDAAIRQSAIDVLGNIGDSDVAPLLEQIASDVDSEVRARVAFALGKIGGSGAIPRLADMLKDERWQVRANAVQALGMIGDRSARPHVQTMLSDPHSVVKDAALGAMEKLP